MPPLRRLKHIQEPVGGDRLLLPLQRQPLDRLGGHGFTDEAIRQVAEQHLPRTGRLLQPGRDVDGIAADERLRCARVASDHLSGVDADAKPDPRAEPAVELIVQGLQPPEHLGGGADGAQRVVLVGDRHAEDGHDGVSDELLHRAGVVLDRHPHLVEVAKHHLAHGLRLEPLAKSGGTGHVAEKDRDRLASLRCGFRKGAPTPAAEEKARRVLGAAARTRPHEATLGQVAEKNLPWREFQEAQQSAPMASERDHFHLGTASAGPGWEGIQAGGRKSGRMERNLAKELALLATEVDSLAKELALARAERASEAKRRERAATEAAHLRNQLQHARERAKASERDLGRFSREAEADAHTAQAIERDLRLQLEAAQDRNAVLQHEVERIERERRVLARNQRELLGNLRHAAQEASAPESSSVATDETTLVPARPTDAGW